MELLVVLLISAILSAAVAPSFYNFLSRNRAQAASTLVYHHLQAARQLAVNTGERTTFCGVDVDGRCTRDDILGFAVFIDRDYNHQIDNDDELRAQLPLSYPGRVSLRASNTSHITFNANGSARQFGSIYLCSERDDTKFARRITVSRAGRVYIAQQGNAGGRIRKADKSAINCASL